MLRQVAESVWIHNSEFLDSKSIIVQGEDGVLLVDPGITSSELADLAADLHDLGQSVVAGFSTHPDWDHVLWHAKFGDVPRYGTAHNAAAMRDFLSKPDWKDQLADFLPPEHAAEISLDDLFGQITGLSAGTTQLPWDGPKVRLLEHQAHAQGHAALFIDERGVLVAGDMLSDTLIPFLDLEAADPIGDYLAALDLFENVADDIKVFVPGHGSVGDTDELRARIKLDRTYVQALRDGDASKDPRLTEGPHKEWLPGVYQWQVQQLTKK
jgi:glyoxylase-like metal-dependent hydrolase (beta-lactamase superfamily II)